MSRGRPFEVGNKASRGRPPGSRNKKTMLMQGVLDSFAPALVRKVAAQALNGDKESQRALLPFILPRPKELAVKTGPLPTGTAEELTHSAQKIVKLMATGKLTPSQAQGIASILEACRRILETKDLEGRVHALEENQAKQDEPDGVGDNRAA